MVAWAASARCRQRLNWSGDQEAISACTPGGIADICRLDPVAGTAAEIAGSVEQGSGRGQQRPGERTRPGSFECFELTVSGRPTSLRKRLHCARPRGLLSLSTLCALAVAETLGGDTDCLLGSMTPPLGACNLQHRTSGKRNKWTERVPLSPLRHDMTCLAKGEMRPVYYTNKCTARLG